jgi:phosphohistidine phosphatase SixA/8-oxo-dGTP pyrophosphatase MutT (NUDIX family)
MAPTPIRAAGVVLTRGTGPSAQTMILYRPLRRDWSLPKGKVDPGEHILDCAVRECDEETGIVPILGVPLGRQRYVVLDRPKIVDYWQGRIAKDNGFVPDDEVAEVRWAGIDEARALLTYRRDVEFVERALALPQTAPLILLRHAAAVSRTDYDGDDQTRPLTGKGRSQARSLASLLQAFGIEQAYSSDAARCVETVRPFATAQRVTIEQEPSFSETGYAQAPEAAVTRLEALLRNGSPTVLCTHRPVFPALFEAVLPLTSGPTRSLLRSVASQGLTPGGFIVLHRTTDSDLRIVAAEHAKPKKADHDARHSLPL